MSDQYQGNQLPGAAYGFPQYYAANQMTNLGYQTQAVIGAQNEMMMHAFHTMPGTMPPLSMAQGSRPRLDAMQDLGAAGTSKRGRKGLGVKKDSPKKKPKKKVTKPKKKVRLGTPLATPLRFFPGSVLTPG